MPMNRKLWLANIKGKLHLSAKSAYLIQRGKHQGGLVWNVTHISTGAIQSSWFNRTDALKVARELNQGVEEMNHGSS